jgi:hypothetical protein
VAILEVHFSKNEQVIRLAGVLKSSAPKDTEVNASWPRRIFDPKPSRSVEFGQKDFRRKSYERDHTKALHEAGYDRHGVPGWIGASGWLVRYFEEQSSGDGYLYPVR